MKRNYSKNKGIYRNNSRSMSKNQRERLEYMLSCIQKNELKPVENYFLNLLSKDKSTAGLTGAANKFSKELDKKQTKAEVKMQDILENMGVVFKSQRIVYYGNGKNFYILDFYSPADKVAIEVDGGYHNGEDQIARDKFRDKTLLEKGIRTVRFKNEEVDNVQETKEKLSKYLQVYSLT